MLGGELSPVEVLQLGPVRSRRVRVRRLDGEYLGLDEWVSTVRLVIPWSEADALLRDERSSLALDAMQPEALEPSIGEAVLQVYFGADSVVDFDLQSHRPLRASIPDVETRRSELPVALSQLLDSPGAFIDSSGELHVGQVAALELAIALCAQRPEPILERCTSEVERWRKAVVSGWIESDYAKEGGYRVDPDRARVHLTKVEKASAVVAVWCGGEATDRFDELERLRAEVERLSSSLTDLAAWLRQAGHPVKAAAVIRNLRA